MPAPRKRGIWRRAFFLLLVGFLLLYPLLFRAPFPQHLMIKLFLFATLAQAWNILGGYGGQVSLGHAVFFGIGAYTSTLLQLNWDLSPWIGLLGGGVLAVAAASIIGYPCFRLAGHYFAIATIAVGEIVQTLAMNWPYVGGAAGLYVPLREESLKTFQFHSTKLPYYYIGLGLVSAVAVTVSWLERSRLGYYLRAIKDDPEAARSVGVDIVRYKLVAMGLSAFFTALAGTFYAQYILFIDPDSTLSLSLSILICLTAVLGGAGSFSGPFLGAAVLIPLSEGTRVFFGGRIGALDLLIYGALIVLIAVLQPGGLMALILMTKPGR